MSGVSDSPDMATVGHGLVGLAVAGLTPVRAGRMQNAFLLPGIMVLLAYGVDVAAWTAVAWNLQGAGPYFASHPPFLAAVLVLSAWIVVGMLCRVRRPWLYLLMALAVASHLLLDYLPLRLRIVEWYLGRSLPHGRPSHAVSFPVEVCVYGLILVLVLLGRGFLERGCSGRARKVSVVLALVCIATAFSRHAVLWGFAYALSVLHVGVLLRRHLAWKLLWNLVLLLPLFPFVATEALMAQRWKTAQALKQTKQYEEALLAYQSALELPTRHGRDGIYIGMGICYEQLGELAQAKRYYLKALEFQPEPHWANVVLAQFYCRHQGTPFYRPDEAIRLYEEVVRAKYAMPEAARKSARFALKRLRDQG